MSKDLSIDGQRWEEAAAEQLARGFVESGLVSCVQVESGVISHYKWKVNIVANRNATDGKVCIFKKY